MSTTFFFFLQSESSKGYCSWSYVTEALGAMVSSTDQIQQAPFMSFFYYTLLWKTCFKCPSREIHSPSGFAVNSNQQRITSSLLSPNTKKAGTDSFSSIPALKPRYPLDNTSFFGCQLFRFRNKISFWFFHSFLSALFLLFSCLLIHPARTSFSFFDFYLSACISLIR